MLGDTQGSALGGSSSLKPWNRRSTAWFIVFSLMLGAGVFFRFAELEHDLVWHDEIYTQIFVSGYGSSDWQARFFQGETFRAGDVQVFLEPAPGRGAFDTVRALALDEPQHPPLYYLAARAWRAIVGDGIGALRALSACASLVCIGLFYWLALELSRQHHVALMATALMSLSPFFVLYAREAREYALFTALAVAASAALLRALRLTRQAQAAARAWALYALLLTLGFYTSLSMAGVALGHGLVVLLASRSERRVLRSAALAFAVTGALFSPWAWAVARHWDSFRASMAWSSNIQITRAELLTHFATSLSRPFMDLFAEPHTAGALLGAIVCSVAAVSAIVITTKRLGPDARAMLLTLALLPVVLFLLPDLVLGGIRSLSARYLTSSLLALLLGAACVLATPGPRARLRLVIAGAIVGLALISVHMDAGREATWNKGISRALPSVAAALEGHHDALVIASREQHHPGNLLALAPRLDADTTLLFAPYEGEFEIPDTPRPIYLFALNPLLRAYVERQTGMHARPLVRDLYADLWVLEPDSP